MTIKVHERSEQRYFDVDCEAFGIEHRLCPLRHPKTIATLVERFDDRVSETVLQTRLKSGAELEAKLTAYCKN